MCYGEALSSAVHRARKRHECDDCCRIVEPGQFYHRWAGKVDGDFQDTKLCRSCFLANERDKEPGECRWLGSGESRAQLRQEPWRATLAWMREAWKRARAPKEASG